MGLQVWLPLTKDLHNQGLLNTTATVNGTTSFITGKLGQALNCNGSSYWILPNITLGSEVSIACWAKTTVNGKMPWVLNADSVTLLNLYVNTYYCLNNADSNNNPFKDSSGNTIAVLTDGMWHHYVVTFGSNVAKLYIDGEYSGTALTFRNPTSTNTTIKLAGGYRDAHSYDWNGAISDFRVYDNCLSEKEIKEISKGLILHYPLNRRGLGNENLLTNTNTEKTGSSATAQWFRWNVVNPMLDTGTTYTLSFDAKMTVTTDVFYISWSNADSTQEIINQGTQVTTEYKRYSFTGQTTKTNINAILISNYKGYNRGNNNNTTGVLSVRNIKLELGDKATPYCPNSTDTLYSSMNLGAAIEYDYSGFNNNGVRTGTFTYINNAPKYNIVTYLASSNGTTGASIYSHGFTINDNKFTVACWVKVVSAVHSGSAEYFICLNNTSYTSDMQFAIFHRTNTLTLIVNNTEYTVQSLTNNIWYHLVLTFDGSSAKTYVNGELKNTTAISNAAYLGTNLNIGARSNSVDGATPAYYSNIYVSDARIYATALSATDVLSLYNNNAYIDESGQIYGPVREV